MEPQHAQQYADEATAQLGAAVAAGDGAAANAVVDRVAADGHTAFANVLNTALTHTSLTDDELTTAERYAIWLVRSGTHDAVYEDLNEGGDSITEGGGTVTDDDAVAGRDLALQIMGWVNNNQAALLALVRGEAHVEPGGAE